MENRDQIRDIVTKATETLHSLREAEHALTRSETAVSYWREVASRLSQERETATRELKRLGYHDIGHARAELAKPEPVLRSAEAPASCANCARQGRS
jgi:hypothetical protein